MLDVVIVGLGRIGAGNSGLAGTIPMSHLDAVLSSEGVQVTALVDPDPLKRLAATEKFSCSGEVAIMGALNTLRPRQGEVIVIATPPECRRKIFYEAVERKPALILMEKPLAANLDDGKAMVALAHHKNIPLLVNFHRRFDSRFSAWRADLPEKPVAATVRYNKGLYNYASHVIDLFSAWYGSVDSVRAIGFNGPNDSAENPSFICRMTAGFDVVYLGTNKVDYEILDGEILGEATRFVFRAGGAELILEQPENDLYYKGYRNLKKTKGDVGPVSGLSEMYAVIRAFIEDGISLSGCCGDEALGNLAVLAAVNGSRIAEGAEIRPKDLLIGDNG